MSDTDESNLDLDAIRRRVKAATPGPWGWRGNIGGSVELRALHSGGLRIISTSRSEPCIGYTADEELVLLDNACKTCTDWLTNGGISSGDGPKCEKAENLDTVWTWHPNGYIRPINDWAKAEVLQWSNRMYRDDVKDTTHPDAEFIAHAREDVPALLAEVERLRAGAQADIDEAVAVATIGSIAKIDRLTAELDWLLARVDEDTLARFQTARAAIAEGREPSVTQPVAAPYDVDGAAPAAGYQREGGAR